MNLLLKNILSLFIPLVLSSVLSVLLNQYGLLFSAVWYWDLGFLLVMGLVFHTVYTFRAGTNDFTQLLLVASVIKLLLALTAIVAYSFFTDKPSFLHAAIQFILHFILFLVFEIAYLHALLKAHPIKHN